MSDKRESEEERLIRACSLRDAVSQSQEGMAAGLHGDR